MEKQLTYLDVIEETIEYYSKDVNRRSQEPDGIRCLYNSPDGRQCAFARCAEHISFKFETGRAAILIKREGIQLKDKYSVKGSPSLILNEGRQIIYGNVGYRVIEANVQELLNQPENQASWC